MLTRKPQAVRPAYNCKASCEATGSLFAATTAGKAPSGPSGFQAACYNSHINAFE